jgi:hypothetical protein
MWFKITSGKKLKTKDFSIYLDVLEGKQVEYIRGKGILSGWEIFIKFSSVW